MLSQVIVMVCAAVATVRSNVGPNVGSMGPNYGGTSQQSQQSQPHSPSHYSPLLYPPFLHPPSMYPPSSYQPSPYRPDLCPPQPCQLQQPYGLQGLSSGNPAYIRGDDGTVYYVEPKNPFDLGHYVPSPGEYDPDAPVIMALGRSGTAAQRGAHRGLGGLGRSKRHAALIAGHHASH